jgi:hypothetical protein
MSRIRSRSAIHYVTTKCPTFQNDVHIINLGERSRPQELPERIYVVLPVKIFGLQISFQSLPFSRLLFPDTKLNVRTVWFAKVGYSYLPYPFSFLLKYWT